MEELATESLYRMKNETLTVHSVYRINEKVLKHYALDLEFKDEIIQLKSLLKEMMDDYKSFGEYSGALLETHITTSLRILSSMDEKLQNRLL